MLIYKSFFRKKNTKIYILVYTLILMVFFLLFSTKIILVQKDNDSYKGSYIQINSNDKTKLNSISNIKEIQEAIVIKEDAYNEFLLIYNHDYNLSYDSIIISSELKDEVGINENLEINVSNKITKLKVKDYDFNNYNKNIIYISEALFNECLKSSEPVFIITLKKWQKEEKSIIELNKLYGSENVAMRYYRGDTTYSTYTIVLNIILVILIVLFLMILIFTCINVIQDENKKNSIYYKIGYSKKKLKIFNITKILLIIIFSFILSILTLMIFLSLYKILI